MPQNSNTQIIGSLQFFGFYYNGKFFVPKSNMQCICCYNIHNTETEIIMPEFDIQVTSNTIYNALHEAARQMSELWDEYAMDEDEHLTRDAIELKQKLLDIFGE